MVVAGERQVAGLVPLRGMGGQRWMDAGVMVTKGEAEVEVEVVGEVAVEEEEESAFPFGWGEIKH